MRLLIVGNEELATLIRNALHSSYYVVDWVGDGQEAWDYLRYPDACTLGILDWSLPRVSGLDLCKKLRGQDNNMPLLLLTPDHCMEDRIMALDSGADDCLSQPFGLEELLARMRALLRRPKQIRPQLLEVQGLILDYQSFTLQLSGYEKQGLMAKEFQLLEYLMTYPNQVITHEQIQVRLWGLTYEPMSNVIAAQVRSLRRKLERAGRRSCIETVRGLGYRLIIE